MYLHDGGVLILTLSTIFLLDFGTVPTVWYFVVFCLFVCLVFFFLFVWFFFYCIYQVERLSVPVCEKGPTKIFFSVNMVQCFNTIRQFLGMWQTDRSNH